MPASRREIPGNRLRAGGFRDQRGRIDAHRARAGILGETGARDNRAGNGTPCGLDPAFRPRPTRSRRAGEPATWLAGPPSGRSPPAQCEQIVAEKRDRMGPIGVTIAAPFMPPPITIPIGR